MKRNWSHYDILIRMELLTPLSEYFENGIDEKDVIRLGIDICKALEICQQYEIVHRDIKPENIFVSQSGSFKLGDFGVAKTMKSIETVMTKAGMYTYMAPELYKGEKSGASVDIYSLGMVMYQLLNYNREPFLPTPPERFTFEQKENALMRRMKGDGLPNPCQASEDLSKVILKACSFNPNERYKSPSEMYDALNRIQDKEKHIIEDTANSYDNYNLIENDEFDKNEETVGLFDYYLNSNTESTSNVQNNVVYDNVPEKSNITNNTNKSCKEIVSEICGTYKMRTFGKDKDELKKIKKVTKNHGENRKYDLNEISQNYRMKSLDDMDKF